MTKEELRAKAEAFSEEVARESYRAGAGLTDRTDFEGIFRRHAALGGDAAWEAARGVRELAEWAADYRIGRKVAPLDDRLHHWESTAVLTLENGEQIPWQRSGIDMANEPDRRRRLAIDRARRALTAEPVAIRIERMGREREELASLCGSDVVTARQKLSGIRLDELGESCGRFLAATRDLYRDLLAERLRRELDLPLDAAHRSDAAWIFRGRGFDEFFPGAELVDIARRQTAEMGIDAEAAGRVRFDVEDREMKRARAFCAPVRVPDEVWLVIRPTGGYQDYRAFWHELGHALHFSHASRDLPFEHRWLGDNSVTEGFAILFEHMLALEPWLDRYTTLGGEKRRTFLRDQALDQLALVRRYAAKLRYELELHRARSFASAGPRYVEHLSDATGFRYEPEDALLDLDDAFYASRYLRAWMLEAGMREMLRDRFDEDFFRNPRTGPYLLDLMARGQRDNGDVLASDVLGHGLSFEPLIRQYEEALA